MFKVSKLSLREIQWPLGLGTPICFLWSLLGSGAQDGGSHPVELSPGPTHASPGPYCSATPWLSLCVSSDTFLTRKGPRGLSCRLASACFQSSAC